MKTIHDAATERSIYYESNPYCDFTAGVKFAQEWISPEEEMPPVGELVQVKVKWRDDNDISYDHDKRHKDETYDDFEINQMVGLEVIGWRPIERK